MINRKGFDYQASRSFVSQVSMKVAGKRLSFCFLAFPPGSSSPQFRFKLLVIGNGISTFVTIMRMVACLDGDDKLSCFLTKILRAFHLTMLRYSNSIIATDLLCRRTLREKRTFPSLLIPITAGQVKVTCAVWAWGENHFKKNAQLPSKDCPSGSRCAHPDSIGNLYCSMDSIWIWINQQGAKSIQTGNLANQPSVQTMIVADLTISRWFASHLDRVNPSLMTTRYWWANDASVQKGRDRTHRVFVSKDPIEFKSLAVPRRLSIWRLELIEVNHSI